LQLLLYKVNSALQTRSSVVAETTRDALCHVKSGLGVTQGH